MQLIKDGEIVGYKKFGHTLCGQNFDHISMTADDFSRIYSLLDSGSQVEIDHLKKHVNHMITKFRHESQIKSLPLPIKEHLKFIRPC